MSKMFEKIEALPPEVLAFVKEAFTSGIPGEELAVELQKMNYLMDVSPENLGMLLKRYKRSLEAEAPEATPVEDDDVDPPTPCC